MGYNTVADIICLSSFVQPLLPPKVAKSRVIPTKFDLIPVQGHRSSILVSSESLYTTFYQSLIVTLAVAATVFEIFTLKDRKSLNFPTKPSLRPQFGGKPLEFCYEIWRKKARIMGLPDGEKIMTLAFFVLTQYWRVTDRQTDRHVAIPITLASIASRG